jgi:hypothetical protein
MRGRKKKNRQNTRTYQVRRVRNSKRPKQQLPAHARGKPTEATTTKAKSGTQQATKVNIMGRKTRTDTSNVRVDRGVGILVVARLRDGGGFFLLFLFLRSA